MTNGDKIGRCKMFWLSVEENYLGWMQFVCIYEDPFGKLIWIMLVG